MTLILFIMYIILLMITYILIKFSNDKFLVDKNCLNLDLNIFKTL